MARAYSEIAFTPTVRAMQSRMGSRSSYAALDTTPDRRDRLGAAEAEFIAARDSFYEATVSESGWPYLQHRGGPTGFLKVLDEKTLGFADFRGNFQFISVGNLQTDDRVALFLMDYTARRRLKIFGRVRVVTEDDDPAAVAALEIPGYRAHVERGFFITVEAYDWNCPQHITPRFTEAEWAERHAEPSVGAGKTAVAVAATDARQEMSPLEIGSGPLTLEVTGVRQLSRRVRAYELRRPDRSDLPPVSAGSHIDIPLLLPDGSVTQRSYSIASNPARRDIYEIAVQREDEGRGGSLAAHSHLHLGMRLHCAPPRNRFALHEDSRPALLIAGGIGITPLKAMAQALHARGNEFALHYIGRDASEMPFHDRLHRSFGSRYRAYFSRGAGAMRPDLAAILAGIPAGTIIYVCGPAGLIADVTAAAKRAGIPTENVRSERFARSVQDNDRPFTLTLTRSGRKMQVTSGQSILEAVESAGIALPSSCRTGECGTCVTRVVSGEADHRDSVLDASQRLTHLCPCISRAAGNSLALEL